MAVNIYINYNGNCKEAVQLYSKVFKTDEPKIMTFGEAPQDPENPIPEEAKNLVMHTYLMISDTMLMFSDILPGMRFEKGNNMTLAVQTGDLKEVEEWFNNLSAEGGTVDMPLQETFWSKCYGAVIDKFGVTWQIMHDEA